MKIIALEEHFSNAAIEEAVGKRMPDLISKSLAAYPQPASHSPLEDLGIGRLQHMDAMGIDVQVLSYTAPGLQVLEASEAVPLARDVNDQVAAAIAAHPDRLAGFATLPTSDPKAAAAELERAVRQLGFVGAMINCPPGQISIS